MKPEYYPALKSLTESAGWKVYKKFLQDEIDRGIQLLVTDDGANIANIHHGVRAWIKMRDFAERELKEFEQSNKGDR